MPSAVNYPDLGVSQARNRVSGKSPLALKSYTKFLSSPAECLSRQWFNSQPKGQRSR